MPENSLYNQLEIVRGMNRVIQSRLGDIERSLAEQESQLEMLKGLYERLDRVQKSTETMTDTIRSIGASPPVDPTSVSELTKSLTDGSKDFNKGGRGILSKIGGAFKAVGVAAFAALGMGLSSLFKMIKGILKISKFSIQSIFDIGQQLFNLASIAISIVQILYEKLLAFAQETFSGGGGEYAQAIQDLKKQYGALDQSTPKAILQMSRNMNALSKAGLSAFRVFGNRAERIKEFLEEFAIKMGPLFDFYAREFAESEGALMATIKGMGLSGDDMEIMARSAISRGMALADELVETHNATRSATKQLGSATKLINRDIAKAMRNVKAFGGSSKDSIAKAASYARSLGLNVNDLTGIAESFLTYDSAVETGEKLLEIFGVRINSYEMMEEQDIGSMIKHLREGFVNAGIDTSTLNKSYTSLLASTVGLDADVARQLLSYKNVGEEFNSSEDMGTKVAGGIKTLSGALDDLASSIEFKVLSGGQLEGGFLSMFLQGLYRAAKMNAHIRPLLRDIVQSLKIVYHEGIRTFQAFEKYFPGVHDFLEGLKRFFNPQRFSLLVTRVNDSFIKLFKGAKDNTYNFTNFYDDIYAAFMDHLDKFNEIDDGRLFDSLWETARSASLVVGDVILEIGKLFAAGIMWVTSLIKGGEESEDLKKVFKDILGKFDGTFSDLGKTVEKTTDAIAQSVTNLFGSIQNLSLIDGIDFNSQSFIENISGIYNKFMKKIEDLYDEVKRISIKVIEIVKEAILVLRDAKKAIRNISVIIGGVSLLFLGTRFAAQLTGSYMRNYRPARLPGVSRLSYALSSGRMPSSSTTSFRSVNYSFNKEQMKLARALFGTDIQKLAILTQEGVLGGGTVTDFRGFAQRVYQNKDLIQRYGQGLHDRMTKVMNKFVSDPVQRAAIKSEFLDPLKRAIDTSSKKGVVHRLLSGLGYGADRFLTPSKTKPKKLPGKPSSTRLPDVKPANLFRPTLTSIRSALNFGAGVARFGAPIALEYLTGKIIDDYVTDLRTNTQLHLLAAGAFSLATGYIIAGAVAPANPIAGAAIAGGTFLLSLGGDILYSLGVDRAQAYSIRGMKEIEAGYKNAATLQSESDNYMEALLKSLRSNTTGIKFNTIDGTVTFPRREPEKIGPELKALVDKQFGNQAEKKVVKELQIKDAKKVIAKLPGDKFEKRQDRRLLISREVKPEEYVANIPVEIFDPLLRINVVDNLLKAESSKDSSQSEIHRNLAKEAISSIVDAQKDSFKIDIIRIYGSGPGGTLTPEGQAFLDGKLLPQFKSAMFDLYSDKIKDPKFQEQLQFHEGVKDIVTKIYEDDRKKEELKSSEAWKSYNDAVKEYKEKLKKYNHLLEFKKMIVTNFELISGFIESNIIQETENNILGFIETVKSQISIMNNEYYSKIFTGIQSLRMALSSIAFKDFSLAMRLFSGGKWTSTDRGSVSFWGMKESIDGIGAIIPTLDLNYLGFDDFVSDLLSMTKGVLVDLFSFLSKFIDKAFMKPFQTLAFPMPDDTEQKDICLYPKEELAYNEDLKNLSRQILAFSTALKDAESSFNDSFIPETNSRLIKVADFLKFSGNFLELRRHLKAFQGMRHKGGDGHYGPPNPKENAFIPKIPQVGDVDFDLSGLNNLEAIISSIKGLSINFLTYSGVRDSLVNFAGAGGSLKALKDFILELPTKLVDRIYNPLKGINGVFDRDKLVLTFLTTKKGENFIKRVREHLVKSADLINKMSSDIETKTAEACSIIFENHIDIHEQISAHGLTKEDLATPEIKITKHHFFKGKFNAHQKTFVRGDVTYNFTYNIEPFNSRKDFENKVFLGHKSVTLDRINAVMIAPSTPFGPSSYYEENDPSLLVYENEDIGSRTPETEFDPNKKAQIDWTIKPNMKYYQIGAWDTARLSP